MFRTNVSLAGWTLGYICYRIRQFKIREASQMNMSVEHQAMYADSFLKGLILTGTCRNYEVSSNDDGSIRIELFQTEIKEFPLEKVSFFNPERKRRVNRVTGRVYNDRTLTDIVNSEHFGSYLYQVVSKQGNRKMFLDTKWAHPFEQTWMSHMYQETIKGNLNPGILLATPTEHNRFEFYPKEDRREN